VMIFCVILALVGIARILLMPPHPYHVT
jgi:hypothetical protein